LENTDNGEVVSVVTDALPRAQIGALGDVDASGGEGDSDEGKEENEVE